MMEIWQSVTGLSLMSWLFFGGALSLGVVLGRLTSRCGHESGR
ncbi:MAG: hypothetical protein ACKVS9_03515 [Phycisphaerae bacterium]